MFTHDFRPEAHIVLSPVPTPEEWDRAYEGWEPAEIYAAIADSLDAEIHASPNEAEAIGQELAALMMHVLEAPNTPPPRDRFDLLPTLLPLPRVFVAMTFNHFFCEEIVRDTRTVHTPS